MASFQSTLNNGLTVGHYPTLGINTSNGGNGSTLTVGTVGNYIYSQNVYQTILTEFEDEYINEVLMNNFDDINYNNMIFRVINKSNKKVEPLETIFKLIADKTTFNLTINRNNYCLILKDFVFLDINNLFNSSSVEKISVSFSYSGISYDNKLMSISEKRNEKFSNILKDKK